MLRLVLTPSSVETESFFLLYRHEYFTGKYTTRKIQTKLHPGLRWRIFPILTSEDIVYFTDIMFEPKTVLQFVGV